MAYAIVVIGTSLGGLAAMEELLPKLPDGFPLPIALVQHRGIESVGRLTPLLQRHTGLKVREPFDKEPIEPGCVYVAPPDYHMLIDDGAIALSTEAPVISARPAINVLFESAADSYRERVIGVVLTGASSDGALGALRIKEAGGKVIVQDPATAECALMPSATLKTGAADWVLSISEIGVRLERLASEP